MLSQPVPYQGRDQLPAAALRRRQLAVPVEPSASAGRRAEAARRLRDSRQRPVQLGIGAAVGDSALGAAAGTGHGRDAAGVGLRLRGGATGLRVRAASGPEGDQAGDVAELDALTSNRVMRRPCLSAFAVPKLCFSLVCLVAAELRTLDRSNVKPVAYIF